MAENQKLHFGPSDELQSYYNDAYMKERERFNNLFGVIEEDALAPSKVETVYVEPSPEKYVTVEDYKKTKRLSGFFIFTTVIFAAAAIVLALKFFQVF